MTRRAMPTVGAEVLIEHLGATEAGVVTAVDPDRLSIEVLGDDERLLLFALNRATATFTLDGAQTGAQLRFVDRG